MNRREQANAEGVRERDIRNRQLLQIQRELERLIQQEPSSGPTMVASNNPSSMESVKGNVMEYARPLQPPKPIPLPEYSVGAGRHNVPLQDQNR
eukprot:m.45590 g.45590  ORF g.45590 m.45590 type:complete len:94 (-) comp8661_c0_seq1:229-510(-)